MFKKEDFLNHFEVDSNLGDCHYGAIIKDSNNEHHERREVKLPNQCQEQKPNYNPNSDRYRIYGIIFHALEYATASKNRVDNHTQPYSFNHVIRIRIRYILTTRFIFIYNFMCHVWNGLWTYSPFLIGFAKTYDEKLFVSSILMCNVLAKKNNNLVESFWVHVRISCIAFAYMLIIF
jgi:hypothetical protein